MKGPSVQHRRLAFDITQRASFFKLGRCVAGHSVQGPDAAERHVVGVQVLLTPTKSLTHSEVRC